MNTLHKSKLLAACLGFCMALAPMQANAEDIDIFTGASAGSAANPNILIILDNSANWSREAQKWEPKPTVQGQAEVNAINSVINSLGAAGSNVNIGLMEYGSEFAGYIRFAVKPMTTIDGINNIASFGTQLNTIYNNITAPSEKVPMNNWYGDLMRDAYNYFAGLAPVTPGSSGVAANPDPAGYTSTGYTQFLSPVSADESCARNFVIFIGNPAQSGPRPDTADNSCALATLNGTTCPGGKFSPQLGLPDFTSTTTTTTSNLGKTSACYSSGDVTTKNSAISTCLAADESNCYATHVDASYIKTDGSSGNSATDCSSYTNNCSIGTTAISNTCASGELRYSVIQTASSGASVDSTAPTTSCYSSSATGTDYGTLTCPSGSTCTYATGAVASACASDPVTSTASTTSCYSSASAVNPDTDHGSLTCPADHTCTYSTGASASTCTSSTSTAYTTSCYSGLTTGSNKWSNSTDYGSLTCPAGAVCTYTSTDTGRTSCGTSPASYHFNVTQTVAMKKYTITQTATPVSTGNRYTITQTATSTSETTTNLGYTAACHASAPTSDTGDYASSCTGSGISCTYGNSPTTSTLDGSCASGNKYPVIGTDVVTTNTPTGTTTVDNNVYNADEWARFLFQKGVPVSGGSNAKINTYTIDVYNAQPDAVETSLYLNMAKFGGGKYFKAGNESEITAALTKILAEIQSVNSTFASASLPVNSTNRAQNANQVFIGMFRPDPSANPRWFGNLKQYQIGSDGTTLDLYDNATPSKPAINVLTGFLDDCAQSFWTTDSPTPTGTLPWIASHYWGNIASDAPAGTCPSSSYNLFSDLPDGAFVEKGAVAEVLRKGNDPATTNAAPTWSFNRNMYTLNASALPANGSAPPAYSSGNSGLATSAFNFTQGKDVNNDSSLTTWTSSTNVMRHTVHGDVIHSRPLPVNYGTTDNVDAGVTVYYGANDGTYRAVLASGSNAGKELWSFVAPEFSSIAASRNTSSSTDPLTRLMSNSPAVNYPVEFPVAGAKPKDYFFDGSTGIYQNEYSTEVWIYPAMRRGGRMIYAFDVTDSSPSSTTTPKFTFKWRAGCPNLTNDTGCADGTGGNATDMIGIGQTWSTPAPAFATGYSTTTPVVAVGGGYDECEDANTAPVPDPVPPETTPVPTCASGKGHAVYVFDGDTGELLKKFATERSVIADVAFIDPNNNGDVDYAYAVDTGGNIYRINFLDPVTNAYLDKDHWTIKKVAYTSGGGRKFQWMPGLLPSDGKVYVALASGDREHPLQSNYPYTTPVTNRLYVYLDDPSDTAATATDLDGGDMSDFTTNTTCDTPGIVPLSSNTDKGWFMDFPGTGEQAVTSAVIAGGMVTVSTNRPIPSTAGTCSTSLGEALGYWVNLFNASGAMGVEGTCGSSDRSGIFAGGGLPPSPVFGTVPIGDVPTTVLIGAIQRSGEASSPIAPQLLRPAVPHTRKLRYWKNSGDN